MNKVLKSESSNEPTGVLFTCIGSDPSFTVFHVCIQLVLKIYKLGNIMKENEYRVLRVRPLSFEFKGFLLSLWLQFKIQGLTL
jgi:hypothetical protein